MNSTQVVFMPEVQPNGTACIEYFGYYVLNYTTQKYYTIYNHNPTDLANSYGKQPGYIMNKTGCSPTENNQSCLIELQPGKTLLCPNILNQS